MSVDNIKNDFSTLLNCFAFSAYSEAKKSLESVNNESDMWIWKQKNYRLSDKIRKEAEKIANGSYREEDAEYIRDVHKEYTFYESVFDIMKEKLKKDLSEEHDKRLALWNTFKECISDDLNMAETSLEELANLDEENVKAQTENWNTKHRALIRYLDYPMRSDIRNDFSEASDFLNDLAPYLKNLSSPWGDEFPWC